ncbi:MAG: tetratricopeptide repeat protein, partial [Gammaproteobacteria bacterium]|nr:tetratricopeptide repeat protein [Gammaproteobacteria bacterium]
RDDKNGTAIEALAILLTEENKLEEAQIKFRQAYSISGGAMQPDLMSRWADLEYKLGNYRRAIDFYLKAIEMSPREAHYHWRISRVYEATGNCAAVRTHLEHYISLINNEDAKRSARNQLLNLFKSPGGRCTETPR